MLGVQSLDQRQSVLPYGALHGHSSRDVHIVAKAATDDYSVRIVGNGGTALTLQQYRAVYSFVRRCVLTGIWSSLSRVNLFLGGLSGCAVPLVNTSGGTTDTLTNFVSGDYGDATGLTGNGTSKYIDTGLQLSSPGTGCMGFYLRNTMSSSAQRVPIGCTNGTDLYRILQSTAPNYVSVWGGTGTTSQNPGVVMPVGCWHLDRSAPTLYRVYLNGSQHLTRNTSTTPGANSQNVYVFAQNASGTAGMHCDASLGMYWVGASIMSNQADLASIVQSLMAALGRNV